mmetsp:Transcript_30428/g.63806  ORF Transcript_30428/g.63806 Transcript_30428/m.63806 type:complete len:177 (-) Transcript_30428:3987-4517(-)
MALLASVLFRGARNNSAGFRVLSATAATSSGSRRSIKSLALSVYFKQPDLGMKDYEILSRASAFLLAVDPDPSRGDNKKGGENGDDPYGHLAKKRARTDPEDAQAVVEVHTRGTPRGRAIAEGPGVARICPERSEADGPLRLLEPRVVAVFVEGLLSPGLVEQGPAGTLRILAGSV